MIASFFSQSPEDKAMKFSVPLSAATMLVISIIGSALAQDANPLPPPQFGDPAIQSLGPDEPAPLTGELSAAARCAAGG